MDSPLNKVLTHTHTHTHTQINSVAFRSFTISCLYIGTNHIRYNIFLLQLPPSKSHMDAGSPPTQPQVTEIPQTFPYLAPLYICLPVCLSWFFPFLPYFLLFFFLSLLRLSRFASFLSFIFSVYFYLSFFFLSFTLFPLSLFLSSFFRPTLILPFLYPFFPPILYIFYRSPSTLSSFLSLPSFLPSLHISLYPPTSLLPTTTSPIPNSSLPYLPPFLPPYLPTSLQGLSSPLLGGRMSWVNEYIISELVCNVYYRG